MAQSTVALFVTASGLSPEETSILVNKLINDAKEPEPDLDSLFSVIRAPGVEFDSLFTEAPIEPFLTGFESASDDTLKALLGNPIGAAPPPTSINSHAMAVLDNRSFRDYTVELSIMVPTNLDARRNGASNYDEPLAWWKCRLPFNQVWGFYSGLMHYGAYEDWCDERFVDDHGIFDVPAMHKTTD